MPFQQIRSNRNNANHVSPTVKTVGGIVFNQPPLAVYAHLPLVLLLLALPEMSLGV